MKELDSVKIGIRLKELRKLHNFTQEQVANYLGFKQAQINKLESGERKLKLSSLIKLCDLYYCSQEYILEGKGEYTKTNFSFRSEDKKLDLETLAEMNRIKSNLEYLTKITKGL